MADIDEFEQAESKPLREQLRDGVETVLAVGFVGAAVVFFWDSAYCWIAEQLGSSQSVVRQAALAVGIPSFLIAAWVMRRDDTEPGFQRAEGAIRSTQGGDEGPLFEDRDGDDGGDCGGE